MNNTNYKEIIDMIEKYNNLERLSSYLNISKEETRRYLLDLKDKGIIDSYLTNQYLHWTLEEDNKLLEEYNMGLTIKEISNIHGRTTGAIRSRLKKYNIEK